MTNKFPIVIEKPKITDAIHVKAIAEEVKLPSFKNIEYEYRGFIIFVKPIEKYKELFRVSSYNLIGKNKEKIVAYLLAEDFKSLNKLHKLDDPEIKFLRKNYGEDNFIYVEQIVTLPEFQGKNIAQKMLDKLKSLSRKKHVAAAIVEKPLFNKRSVNFFVAKNKWKRLGFILRENIQAGIYGD